MPVANRNIHHEDEGSFMSGTFKPRNKFDVSMATDVAKVSGKIPCDEYIEVLPPGYQKKIDEAKPELWDSSKALVKDQVGDEIELDLRPYLSDKSVSVQGSKRQIKVLRMSSARLST